MYLRTRIKKSPKIKVNMPSNKNNCFKRVDSKDVLKVDSNNALKVDSGNASI